MVCIEGFTSQVPSAPAGGTVARKLGEIAEHVGGRLRGDPDLVIQGLAGLLDAMPGDLSFVADPRYRDVLAESSASAVVVGVDHGSCRLPSITVEAPLQAMERLVPWFRADEPLPVAGIDPRAAVAEAAELAEGVVIMANATVMPRARIGARSVLYPGVFVGAGVILGDDCVLHPGVSLRARVHLGNRVTVHSGSVIGSDGFGYRQGPTGHEKIEHIGTVLIEDDVEIGANVTIDRARFGRTRIGKGSKIDNLVHVAHNVQIGRHCVVIAQTGISGSAVIGDGCMIGGQAGIVGHVRIGPRAMLAARSGISKDVPAGAVVYGFVAGDHRVRKREEAAVRRLPDLMRRVRELEAELEALKRRGGDGGVDPQED